MDSFKVRIVVKDSSKALKIVNLFSKVRLTHKVEFSIWNIGRKEELRDMLLYENFTEDLKINVGSLEIDALITEYPNAHYTEQCRDVGIKIRILK